MQGLILAAGMGRRLENYIKGKIKCMLEIKGQTLISRQIAALKSVGIQKIVIVCGYKKDDLKRYITENVKGIEIVFIDNDSYETTNNIYSVFLAREYLKNDDTLLIESDLIFEESIIREIVDDKSSNIVAVSKYKTWMDGTVVTIDNNYINNIYTKKEFNSENIRNYYKTMNIYKLSRNFSVEQYVPYLERYILENKKNEFYEVIFKELIQNKDIKLKAKIFNKEKWYEIDTIQDLDIANCLFGDRVNNYQKRYGGYWRFNNIKDFCYLENPKFPPKEMLDKISNFSKSLITRLSI